MRDALFMTLIFYYGHSLWLWMLIENYKAPKAEPFAHDSCFSCEGSSQLNCIMQDDKCDGVKNHFLYLSPILNENELWADCILGLAREQFKEMGEDR